MYNISLSSKLNGPKDDKQLQSNPNEMYINEVHAEVGRITWLMSNGHFPKGFHFPPPQSILHCPV